MSLTHDRTASSSRTVLRRAFEVVALAEAVSWLGLLVGMFFKWVVQSTERGVEIFGPIHGAVFVAYVVLALTCWRAYRWSPGVLLAALVASIPPFATVVFERWAARRPDRVWTPPSR